RHVEALVGRSDFASVDDVFDVLIGEDAAVLCRDRGQVLRFYSWNDFEFGAVALATFRMARGAMLVEISPALRDRCGRWRLPWSWGWCRQVIFILRICA